MLSWVVRGTRKFGFWEQNFALRKNVMNNWQQPLEKRFANIIGSALNNNITRTLRSVLEFRDKVLKYLISRLII